MVEYTYYPGKNRQNYAYNDAVDKHKYDVKYMAAIDLDEFLVPENTGTIDDFVQILESRNDIGGIGVHWCCFGSSGYKIAPIGGVLDNYLYRASDDFEDHIAIKTIFNPRRVIAVPNLHFAIYRHGFNNVNEELEVIKGACDLHIVYDKIRINHYFCKSEEECRKKIERGKADVDGKYSWSQFLRYDRNDVYDNTILRIRDSLKK